MTQLLIISTSRRRDTCTDTANINPKLHLKTSQLPIISQLTLISLCISTSNQIQYIKIYSSWHLEVMLRDMVSKA